MPQLFYYQWARFTCSSLLHLRLELFCSHCRYLNPRPSHLFANEMTTVQRHLVKYLMKKTVGSRKENKKTRYQKILLTVMIVRNFLSTDRNWFRNLRQKIAEQPPQQNFIFRQKRSLRGSQLQTRLL